MSRIRGGSPRAALVCVGVWRRSNVTLDTIIQRDCAEAGGTFVSVRDLYGQRVMHSVAGSRTWIGRADDFHPGDAGHAAIAQRVESALGV